jgi:hypothetical protein
MRPSLPAAAAPYHASSVVYATAPLCPSTEQAWGVLGTQRNISVKATVLAVGAVRADAAIRRLNQMQIVPGPGRPCDPPPPAGFPTSVRLGLVGILTLECDPGGGKRLGAHHHT